MYAIKKICKISQTVRSTFLAGDLKHLLAVVGGHNVLEPVVLQLNAHGAGA